LDDAVHEVFTRLVKPTGADEPTPRRWSDRKHFYRTAAKAVRFLRIDHARRRKVMHLDSNHPGARPQPADDLARAEQLLRLDAAPRQLAGSDPEAAEVVELHYFGIRLPAAGAGEPVPPAEQLTGEQIGELIGKSRATVSRILSRGLRQLARQLRPDAGE